MSGPNSGTDDGDAAERRELYRRHPERDPKVNNPERLVTAAAVLALVVAAAITSNQDKVDWPFDGMNSVAPQTGVEHVGMGAPLPEGMPPIALPE